MESRHPVLGVVGGASMGLGIALLLFVYGIVPMTALWLILIVLVGALLGWILSRTTPAGDSAEVDSAPPPALDTDADRPTSEEP